MKNKVCIFLLLIVASFAYAQNGGWEGSTAMAQNGEFPTTGFFAASNSFPRNTVVEVENPANGKKVSVIIISRIDDPNLFMVISKQAADELGMSEDDVIQSSVSVISSASEELTNNEQDSPYNPDPDINPAASALNPEEARYLQALEELRQRYGQPAESEGSVESADAEVPDETADTETIAEVTEPETTGQTVTVAEVTEPENTDQTDTETVEITDETADTEAVAEGTEPETTEQADTETAEITDETADTEVVAEATDSENTEQTELVSDNQFESVDDLAPTVVDLYSEPLTDGMDQLRNPENPAVDEDDTTLLSQSEYEQPGMEDTDYDESIDNPVEPRDELLAATTDETYDPELNIAEAADEPVHVQEIPASNEDGFRQTADPDLAFNDIVPPGDPDILTDVPAADSALTLAEEDRDYTAALPEERLDVPVFADISSRAFTDEELALILPEPEYAWEEPVFTEEYPSPDMLSANRTDLSAPSTPYELTEIPAYSNLAYSSLDDSGYEYDRFAAIPEVYDEVSIEDAFGEPVNSDLDVAIQDLPETRNAEEAELLVDDTYSTPIHDRNFGSVAIASPEVTDVNADSAVADTMSVEPEAENYAFGEESTPDDPLALSGYDIFAADPYSARDSLLTSQLPVFRGAVDYPEYLDMAAEQPEEEPLASILGDRELSVTDDADLYPDVENLASEPGVADGPMYIVEMEPKTPDNSSLGWTYDEFDADPLESEYPTFSESDTPDVPENQSLRIDDMLYTLQNDGTTYDVPLDEEPETPAGIDIPNTEYVLDNQPESEDFPELAEVPGVVEDNPEYEIIEYPERIELVLEPAEFRPPDELALPDENTSAELAEGTVHEGSDSGAIANAESDTDSGTTEVTLVPAEGTEDSARTEPFPITEQLETGNDYLQLAVYSERDSAVKLYNSLLDSYPVTVMVAESINAKNYRILVGPLNPDESGLLLYSLKQKGFKDAFLKRAN